MLDFYKSSGSAQAYHKLPFLCVHYLDMRKIRTRCVIMVKPQNDELMGCYDSISENRFPILVY